MTTLTFQSFCSKRNIERAFELSGYGELPKLEPGWDQSYFNRKLREKERRDDIQFEASMKTPCLVELRATDKCACEERNTHLGKGFTCGKCTTRRSKPSCLYWIDACAGYVYCDASQHVSKLGTTLSCSCGQKSNCTPKLGVYRPPGIHYTPKLLLTDVSVEFRINRHECVEALNQETSSVIMTQHLKKRFQKCEHDNACNETVSVNSPQLIVGCVAMTGASQLKAVNRVANHLHHEDKATAEPCEHIDNTKSSSKNITFQPESVQVFRVVECTFWILGEYVTHRDAPEYVFDARDMPIEQLEEKIASLKQQFLDEHFPAFSNDESKSTYIEFVEEEIEHQEQLMERFNV